MAEHQTESGWVISSAGCWRPGIFDSQRTARLAYRFSDEEIERLRPNKPRDYESMGPIRAEELKAGRSMPGPGIQPTQSPTTEDAGP